MQTNPIISTVSSEAIERTAARTRYTEHMDTDTKPESSMQTVRFTVKDITVCLLPLGTLTVAGNTF